MWFWEGHFLDPRRDANDLLSMLWTWQMGDVGATPGFDGDHVKALRSIRADLIALPAAPWTCGTSTTWSKSCCSADPSPLNESLPGGPARSYDSGRSWQS